MSTVTKARSALRLLGRGDFPALRRQWARHRREVRLRAAGGSAFIHQDHGVTAVCHPAWPDSAAAFLDGPSDTWEFAVLRAWLGAGDTFLDVGANVGWFSFAALEAVGAAGAVVAVDAAPFIVARLDEARALLGHPALRPRLAAVTDAPGEVVFHVRPDGHLTTEQSLQPGAGTIPVTVPAAPLAGLADGAPPAAVKIDIEGAEALALRAIPPGWAGPDGPLWIVELNPAALARFGATPAELAARFPADAFERWLLAKHPRTPGAPNRLAPLSPAETFTDSLYYNLVAVPRGAAGRERRARLAPLLPAPAGS